MGYAKLPGCYPAKGAFKRSLECGVQSGRQAASLGGWRLLDTGKRRIVDMGYGKLAGYHPANKGASKWSKECGVQPDGKQLVWGGGSEDFSVELWIWDTASWQAVTQLQGHLYTIFSVAYSPDGKQLASASGDGTVVI